MNGTRCSQRTRPLTLETLENRVLLSQTSLAIDGPRDAVFDPARGLLYVTTARGKLERYDLAGHALLAPWSVGSSLNGADITADGSALYVAEDALTADLKGVVHKVDLDTGQVTNLVYARYDVYERGSLDVAIAANGKAYVTSEWTYSDHKGPIVEVDIATGTVTRNAKLVGQIHTEVARSVDRTRIAVGRPYAGVRVFDALSGAVTANGGGSYLPGYNGAAAVSGDGHLVTTVAQNFGLSVITDTGAAVMNLAPGTAMSAFDPGGGRLYVASYDGVVGYNTTTWEREFAADATIAGGTFSPIGRMTVDGQGTRLAIVSPTSNVVDLIDVTPGTGQPAKLEVAGYPQFGVTGATGTFTVTVRDAQGAIATGYRGTISVSVDDAAATVPLAYTFTDQDAGTRTFPVTFRTVGLHEITVTDGGLGVAATQSLIDVRLPSPQQTIYNVGATNVHDPSRGLLYITSAYQILRYEPITQRMLPAIDLDGFPPTDIDITPDARYLYVGTSHRSMNFGWLLRVDLDTLAVTRVAYPLARADEAGARSVAVAANGRVVFNTATDSSSSYGFLRDYDPATGAFTVRTDFDSDGWLETRSVVSRSDDHSLVFIGEAYAGSRGVYDSATNHITYYSGNTQAGAYASVNRDGTRLASGGNLLDRTLNLVRTFGGGTVVASGFDPVLPRLYAAEYGVGIVAYDTGTWAKLYTIPADVPQAADAGTIVNVSPDGRWITYTGGNGINVLPLFSRPVITSTPPIVAPGTPFTVVVAARTPAGANDAAYRGVAHFTSSDPAALLPADAAFAAADLGQRSVSVAFNTPGRHWLTVTDPASGAASILYDVFVRGVDVDGEGVLSVITTDAADTILLAADTGGGVRLVVNGGPPTLFPAGLVRRIDVKTFGGNDAMTLDRVPGGAVDLGGGNDALDATVGDDAARPLWVVGGDNNDSATLRRGGIQPLRFTGDAGTDGVTILGTAGDDVIELRGTSATVNGTLLDALGVESFAFLAGGGNDAIGGWVNAGQTLLASVDAGDGNDAMSIAAGGWGGTGVRRVAILGGNGDDSLTLPPPGAGATSYDFLSFTGGAGTDTVTLVGGDKGNSFAVTGTAVSYGNNNVAYAGVEGLRFNAGAGGDYFDVSAGASLPPLTIDAGAGPDLLALNSGPTAGFPTLLGGAGDDRVIVAATSTGGLSFDGGAGADSVTWSTSNVASTVVATTGGISGSGRQVFADNWEAATITGGTGADTIRVTPSVAVAFTIAAAAPTTAAGDRLIVDPVGAADVALTPAGVGAGTYAFTNRQPVTFTGIETLLLLPAAGPVAFNPDSGSRLTVPFSVDVGASIQPGDVNVVNVAGGAALAVSLAYDPAAHVAEVAFPGFPSGLPDGNYRMTIPASGVTDTAGNPMSGGIAFDFFVLAGDADRDRTVGFSDLVVVAQHYGVSGADATWSNGDFDDDGTVGFADLVAVAQRYGKTLAPPAPAAGAAAPMPAAILSSPEIAGPAVETARADGAGGAPVATSKPKPIAESSRTSVPRSAPVTPGAKKVEAVQAPRTAAFGSRRIKRRQVWADRIG